MEIDAAVRALGALAQESRLRVFRSLARRGSGGMAAGELAAELDVRPSTLSFHLRDLEGAGLVTCERRGRSLRYALEPSALNELFWFLGEDCCQGRVELCAPFTARMDSRRDEAAAAAGPRAAVLFVCSHNSARSQMAEALLRRDAGDRFDVHSCGLRPSEVHPLTKRALEEVGVETSGLRSKDLGSFLGKVPIHYSIVVCEAAQADCPKVYPFAVEQMYWPFPDPAAAEGTELERLAVFCSVRDGIHERIRQWLRDVPVRAAAEGM